MNFRLTDVVSIFEEGGHSPRRVKILAPCLIFFLSLLSTIPTSSADCINPTGVEGQQIYNGTYKTMQFCDGIDWYSMKGGNSANGGLSDTTNCFDGGPVGFDQASNGIRCLDISPDAFSFTDQTDVAPESLISSDIIQITGIADPATVQLYGDGSPEFRICTDGTSESNCDSTTTYTWGSSSRPIENNQYIQLRFTSGGASSPTHNANISIGDASDVWSTTSCMATATVYVQNTSYTECSLAYNLADNSCYFNSSGSSTVSTECTLYPTPSAGSTGGWYGFDGSVSSGGCISRVSMCTTAGAQRFPGGSGNICPAGTLTTCYRKFTKP